MRLKLLIVDDHAEIRALLRQVCLVSTEDCRECTDGEAGAREYAAFSPDWVVMDIAMPKMDGLTATRRIKELDPEARIVILTQLKKAQFQQAALDAGATHFLSKEDLLTLRDILK